MKKVILSLLALSILFSCGKTDPDNGNSNTDKPGTLSSCSVSGVAQKGQLAKGSQVTAFAIDNSLVATGESFPANISDDKGSFVITGKTTAPFLELRVDGYYFNELTGKMSANPLYLDAFVKSSDKQANLNLMTTAIKLRVKNLVKGGKSFEAAQSQAQSEFLKALGIDAKTGNFEDMDITKGTESDAVLLAVACMIQYGRTAGEVTTLVQELASDLESDGTLSSTNAEKVTNSKSSIDVFLVIENLDKYYKDKNISDALMPKFYGILDEKLNKDFVIYETDCRAGIISQEAPEDAWYHSIVGSYKILSQIEFEVSTDCNWITVSSEHIIGPDYKVVFSGEENHEKAPRTGHIIFKDKSGNVLETIEHKQGEYIEPRCLLYLDFSYETKASLTEATPQIGDSVLVNKDLVVVKEFRNGYPVVEVTPNLIYRVSWPAKNMGYNDIPAYVVKTFPAEVESGAVAQYYGGLQLKDINDVYTPHVISMRGSSSVMQFNTGNHPQASYAIITGNEDDDCLSGTATYVWILNDLNLDPSLKEFYSFENKSRSVRVNKLDNSSSNYVEILPQTFGNGITIQLFDSSGKELKKVTTSKSVTLSRGTRSSFGQIPL